MTAHRQFFDRPGSPALIAAARGLLVIALAVLTYHSIMPATGPASVAHLDKILHAAAYAVIAGLLAFAGPRLHLIWVFLLPSLYGAMMELAQAMGSHGRTASIYDMLANMAGAALMTGLVWIILRRRARN